MIVYLKFILFFVFVGYTQFLYKQSGTFLGVPFIDLCFIFFLFWHKEKITAFIKKIKSRCVL